MGQTNRLSARGVANAGPGYHHDGGGLYLLVSASGSASWVLRYRIGGKAREMGLGSARVFTLAEARQRALDQRKLIADGIDPLVQRAAARAATVRTWGQAVDQYIAAHRSAWRNDAQAAQWAQSLTDHGPSRDLPVTAITTAVIVDALSKIWPTLTETGTRVRGRIERIWAAERTAGNVAGDNPARWRGHLDTLLAAPRKVTKPAHFSAMPYAELPAFWRELVSGASVSRLALQFAILTAARTGEVTGMQWSEVDGEVWTIPGARMKSGRAHSVPLSAAALAVLEQRPRDQPPFALSENAMLTTLQRPPPRGLGRPYTVHGFRSAFRDWAAECTAFPAEVVEMALAHAIRDKTEAAYRRGDLMAKRRELMTAWAGYVVG